MFFSPSPALSAEFAASARLGADFRLAVLRPNPLERGRAGSPVGDTARGAYRSPRRGRPSPSPGRGRSAGSAPDPREDPAGFEKGRLGERRTQLLVRLHLLHVAHNAPAAAPGEEEPNVPHRDRGFAPTPLPWILFFLRCANKSSLDANFFPFQPLLQTNFRAIGGRKKENSEPNSPLMNTPGFGAGDDPPSTSARGVFPLFSQ